MILRDLMTPEQLQDYRQEMLTDQRKSLRLALELPLGRHASSIYTRKARIARMLAIRYTIHGLRHALKVTHEHPVPESA